MFLSSTFSFALFTSGYSPHPYQPFAITTCIPLFSCAGRSLSFEGRTDSWLLLSFAFLLTFSAPLLQQRAGCFLMTIFLYGYHGQA